MAEELSPRERRRRRAGCAALVILVIGIAIGYGIAMLMDGEEPKAEERWPFEVPIPDVGKMVNERLDEMRQMALADINGDLTPEQRMLRTQVLDQIIELLDADRQSTEPEWEANAAKCVEEAYQELQKSPPDWANCLKILQTCVEELDPPH